MMNTRKLFHVSWVLIVSALVGFGCNQVVTVYWSKPGAGNAELQQDKDECQSLQRAAGLDENRIGKCLEAKGWAQVRTESQSMDEGEKEE